jgi:hypothetical protein
MRTAYETITGMLSQYSLEYDFSGQQKWRRSALAISGLV